MLTKEECEKALEQLDVNCWSCEYACDMSDDKPCVLKEIIGKLINQHFDNSVGFSNFKLHADSTLKSLTKNELIEYIHMCYHNWQVCDAAYKNVVKANFSLLNENKNLEKALDKACEILRGYTYSDFPKAKADWEKETWKAQLLKEVQEDE